MPNEESKGTVTATPPGLSEEEAAARLRIDGYNELPSSRPRRVLAIALEVLSEPMILLLFAAGAVYLVLGSLEEALLLLASITFIIGISFYQQRRTERALEALRDLSSPRALVVRDGQRRRIPGREVVQGDLVSMSAGDRVPADGVLLTAADLSVDESLLTGESVPVRKTAGPNEAVALAPPGGDGTPFVYSGTLVVDGQGLAEVRATGGRTALGRIGTALQDVSIEETPLQRETGRLARLLAMLALAVCAVVVVVYGATREDWLTGLLVGITLAMSLIPEEVPVVLAVFLALGAWRIAQQRVLTRRVPAIEALGAATVLCVDKTGTLTLNRMSVRRLSSEDEVRDEDGEEGSLSPALLELVRFSVLASEVDVLDPMDQALEALSERYPVGGNGRPPGWELVHEYAINSTLLAMTHVWRSPTEDAAVVATKGAPEAIISLCRLDLGAAAGVDARVREMADDGLRVIGVAKAAYRGSEWPADPYGFDFELVGLVGLADPLRPSVPAALDQCRTAGVRVVMITGDYSVTARAIARQIGLGPLDSVMTGAELERLTDKELRERVRSTNIFARVVPEQKLRLVEAFKANGEIVAMTGDGVNDAPALKAAHIGIAMGGRGTDVAREASALVLLDDDFPSIVEAIRLGRRIFDNLRKAMAYIVAIHVPIAAVALMPVLLRWPLILLPVHIVFLELIIDPASSIVFEAEPDEPDAMRKPPRDPRAPLFSRRMIGSSLLQGGSVAVIVLVVFALALTMGRGESEARALTFTTLIVGNLSLILANRSRSTTILGALERPTPALCIVVGGGLALLALVLYVPGLTDLFDLAPLSATDLTMSVAAGLTSVLWLQGLSLVRRRPANVASG